MKKRAHPSRWIVYVLRCADGSLYTGITNDLRRRLAAHRAGTASRYTRARGPVRVVHREPAADRGAVVALLLAALCIRLGIWQLHRLHERRARNALIAAARAMPPIELPAA